jgi:spermidine synthase
VLHFGLGGGSLPDFIHRHDPQAFQRVVEINPGVVEVAYRYFELPVSLRLEVVVREGADFLRQDTETYDLIYLDAFQADGAAPHLNTATIFRMLAARLAPGGWLVDNAWGSDRENLIRVRNGLAAVFPQMVSLSVRANSNVIFVVGLQDRMPSNQAILRRAEILSRRFPLDFTAIAHRLRPLFPSAGPASLSPGLAR